LKAKPEIIVIATPNYLHKQMSLDALSMGIDIIKEKPLAANYRDAYEVLKASQKADKLIATTQQRFFSPLFLKAKTLIPSLGKIINFSYRFTLNDTTKSWRWDLEKAFELLSDNFKKGHGFDYWKQGYQSLLDTTVIKIEDDKKVKDRVTIKLSTKDMVDDEIVYKYFEGYWDVKNINGKWRLWDPEIKEVENPDFLWFYE